MADLHDQDLVGGLDSVDHAVVADAEAAGASEAVAQRFAKLEGVGGELGFDRAADLAFGGFGERVERLLYDSGVPPKLRVATVLR